MDAPVEAGQSPGLTNHNEGESFGAAAVVLQVANLPLESPTISTGVVTSVTTSGLGITNGNGDLDAGKTVTLSVNFTVPVTFRRYNSVANPHPERWRNGPLQRGFRDVVADVHLHHSSGGQHK